MEGYRSSTYGDRFADVYDAWYHDVSDVDATVARVEALAGGAAGGERRAGRVLELGAGSGRLAIPLADRGLDVWAVDSSAAMLDRLRAKPHGDRVRAVVDDMADLTAPELTASAAEHGFDVVLCAFNTLFNLTDTAAQRRCLTRVAQLLAPDGRLVVEAFVPPPGGERDSAVGAVEPRHIGLDEVVLSVSRLDPASRTITGQYVQITERGVRLRPWVLHYTTPEGLDALASEAGLRLVDRHAGWRDEPFTPAAEQHVSTYAPVAPGEAIR
ncbi:MAG: class I SAM-dependent methyltransferase [Acidimicrobiales bacterium]|nr:class I SAM-dependent methyltransferase [Acidimicrobiales bacterium]